jgi:hypothetical protein
LLVLSFHELLYFRHLHTVSFPRGEGGPARFPHPLEVRPDRLLKDPLAADREEGPDYGRPSVPRRARPGDGGERRVGGKEPRWDLHVEGPTRGRDHRLYHLQGKAGWTVWSRPTTAYP